MTIEQALTSLSQYPIPSAFVDTMLMRIGLSGQETFTQEVANSREFKAAKAEVYLYLMTAPSVSENGFTISLDSTAKTTYRELYEQLQSELGASSALEVDYGYKGEDL